MTTPLQAGKSPFKAPPATETAGLWFKNNYFNLKIFLPKP